MVDYKKLTGSHDLSLPDWGPYAYDVFGASHVTDLAKGLRMDFFFVPALYRRLAFAPETLRECSFIPWRCDRDFSFWEGRQTLIPGAFRSTEDLFYCQTSFCRLSDNFRLVRVHFANHTEQLREVSLFAFARLGRQEAFEPTFPDGANWLDALAYDDLHFKSPRVDDGLVWCNGRRGETEHPQAVGGHCLGCPYTGREDLTFFGEEKGDCATWTIPAMSPGRIFLRANLAAGQTISLQVELGGQQDNVTIIGTGNFELYPLNLDCRGDERLVLTSLADCRGASPLIDGFAIAPAAIPVTELRFQPISNSVNPQAMVETEGNRALLSGDGFAAKYLFWWDTNPAVVRQYWVDDVRKLMLYSYGIRHPLYRPEEIARDCRPEEFCLECYQTPVDVPANGSLNLYYIIGSANNTENLQEDFSRLPQTAEAFEAIYDKCRAGAFRFDNPLAGERVNFGQQILAANVMTNCIFPVKCGAKYIRHHSPEKYFHSLYTWDSGFIGLGLSELDLDRAIENLNAYITEESEINAFVHHGTPLPVQAYLYAEIWNRSQDLAMLAHYYPRLRRFYDFIAGHNASSTFRKFKTNLLSSFDYFYNSGGWDDYPAQWFLYRNPGLANCTSPAVTTSHAIRFARILTQAANLLQTNGLMTDVQHQQDIALYETDIQVLAEALQKYSWSETDGIFSYVLHQPDGSFKEQWRDEETGINYNFGFDGVSPLISAVCPDNQQKLLWNRLKDEKHLWTKFGLTAVDQSVPYFKKDGYWNGSVWMPHQWFFWKAALSAGEAEFARRIAKTAIQVLSEETAESRQTYEHYSSLTGHGAGCPHFGGLTSIVLNFYNAYYQTGRLTTGLDTWIISQSTLPGGGLAAVLDTDKAQVNQGIALYATGRNEGAWQVTVNGLPVPFSQFDDGTLEISVPSSGQSELRIEAK